MFFLRVLPIFFFAQLGFSAPTMVSTNTNAVYHLFRPVPKSNLQPMESDLLVATQSPRTVDAGHSILSVDIDWIFRDEAGQNFPSLKMLYRLGIVKKFEVGFYYLFSPLPGIADNHFIAFKCKWSLSPDPADIFQLSFTPYIGLGSDLGWQVGLVIPGEVRLGEKFKLGLSASGNINKYISIANAQYFPRSTIYYWDALPKFPIGLIDPQPVLEYALEFSHSVLLRYFPVHHISFFIEYAGKWLAVPNAIFSPPSRFSAQASLGVEFTFWKNLQIALAPRVELSEGSLQFAAKAGFAYRF